MTNADKYLKAGVSETDIDLLAVEIIKHIDIEYMKKEHCYSRICPSYITTFFSKQIKPTLAEDEKVILRNIHGSYGYIGRIEETNRLYICEQPKMGYYQFFNGFHFMFKFIKPRRRILNQRVAGGIMDNCKWLNKTFGDGYWICNGLLKPTSAEICETCTEKCIEKTIEENNEEEE